MKRFFTVLLTFMLLVTSMMTSFTPIRAEDGDIVDQATTTEVISSEEDNDDEEIVLVEDDLPEEEDDTSDDEEIIEEQSEEDDDVVVPEENEEDEIVLEELEEIEEKIVILEDKENTAVPKSLGFTVMNANGGVYLTIGKDSGGWISATYGANKARFNFYEGDTLFQTYEVFGRTGAGEVFMNEFFYWGHFGDLRLNSLQLISDKFKDNTTYRVVIQVDGYEDAVVFANLSKVLGISLCKPVPADADAVFNANGDLVITSSDTNWLNALDNMHYEHYQKEVGSEGGYGLVPERTTYFGGGYVSVDGVKLQNTGKIQNKDHQKTDPSTVATDKEINYAYSSGNSLTIPAAKLAEMGITGDKHSVELSAEGYETYLIEETTPILENTINVTLDTDGNIVIECTDSSIKEAFIENLDNDKDTKTSYVEVMMGSNSVQRFTYKDIEKVSGKAQISAQTIKERFNHNITGNVSIKVKSKGYEPVTKQDIFLPYIAVRNGITYSETTKEFSTCLNVPAVLENGYVNNSNTVSWEIEMKINDSFVPVDINLVDYDEGHRGQLSLTPKSLDVSYIRVNSTYGGIKDSLVLAVSAEGLRVVAAKKADQTFVGAENVQMEATAYLNDEPLQGVLSYRIDPASTKATVDAEGNLTLLEPGEVTVVAYVADKEASTKYTIYKYDPDTNAKLTIEPPTNSLEVGETYQLVAKVGNKAVDPKDLQFNTQTAAVVDSTGLVTAKKKGTAKFTVTLKGSGKDKKATVTINVIDKVFKELQLDVAGESGDIDYYDDVIGSKKMITATGIDLNDDIFPGIETVKYTSSDTSVITVSSKGELSFKKAGVATITGTVSTNPKEMTAVTATLTITVRDFTPRLNTNEGYVYTVLGYTSTFMAVPAYQDRPDALTFDVDDISITGGYEIEEIGTNTYKLVVPEAIKDTVKTKKETLTIATDQGPVYNFDFKVNVYRKELSAKFKTSGEYNTFTKENSLRLNLTRSTGLVYSVEAEWFDVVWDDSFYRWEGNVTLKDPSVKSGEATVRFYNADQTGPMNETVKIKLSFKVTNKKPTVKLNTSSVNVYMPDGDTEPTKSISVKFLNEKKYQYYQGTVIVNGLGMVDKEIDLTYGELTIPIDSGMIDKSGTLTISYKGLNNEGIEWAGTVDNKLTVKKITKLPKVSFKTTTAKLNRNYNENVRIDVVVSGSNDAKLQVVKLNPDPNNPGVANINYWGGDVVHISVSEEGKSAANGKYVYTFTPEFANGLTADPIKLTVDLNNKEAKVAISVKGDINPIQQSSAIGTFKVSNANINVFNVEIDPSAGFPYSDDLEVGYAWHYSYGNIITVKLTDNGRNNPNLPKTIEIPLSVYLSGGDELKTTMKVKINRKAPKIVNYSTKKITLFDTTNNGHIGNAWLYPNAMCSTTPEKVNITIDKDTGAYKVDVIDINEYGEITLGVKLVDGSKVKAGSSQTVVVKIQWDGDLDGKYISTHKFTIQDVSNKIKKK